MASCREGILQERRGLQSWTDPLNQSVFARRREGAAPARVHRHRARQQATCLGVKPRILVGSTKKSHICSGHREGGNRLKLTWCLSPIWRPLLSDTFFLFVSRLT